jgi:hypothetical protein
MLRLFRSTFASFLSGRLRLRRVAALGVALLLAGGSLVSASHTAHASGGGGLLYVHTATSANIGGASTLLDNDVTNNNPDALIFVTADWTFAGAVDDHPLGVWYDAFESKWAIFNEDLAPMPVGSAFNVYAFSEQNASAFQLTATTANTHGNYAYLNNPTLGGNIYAKLLVTQDWSPNDIYNPHNIAIRNDSARVEWGIYNPDGAAIPLGATFNLIDITSLSSSAIFQVAVSSNTIDAFTCINNAATNNNLSAMLLITYNLDYTAKYTDTSGVWYDFYSKEWCIFDASFKNIPLGAVFFVLLNDSGQ